MADKQAVAEKEAENLGGDRGGVEGVTSPRIRKRDIEPSMFACKQLRRGHMRLEYEKSASASFITFMKGAPEEKIISFWRGIQDEVESKRSLEHYHLKVPGRGPLAVEILYGEEREGPPFVKEEECISCSMVAAIFPGMTSGETVIPEYSDSGLVRCSMDAQARPMFVITPVRHAERLSELNDDELLAMWKTASELLIREKLNYEVMVLNHGNYRNLPHLHLKIRVSENSLTTSRAFWTKERLEVWKKLQNMCPQKKQVCRFFFQKGYCRDGSTCRYSHSKNNDQ